MGIKGFHKLLQEIALTRSDLGRLPHPHGDSSPADAPARRADSGSELCPSSLRCVLLDSNALHWQIARVASALADGVAVEDALENGDSAEFVKGGFHTLASLGHFAGIHECTLALVRYFRALGLEPVALYDGPGDAEEAALRAAVAADREAERWKGRQALEKLLSHPGAARDVLHSYGNQTPVGAGFPPAPATPAPAAVDDFVDDDVEGAEGSVAAERDVMELTGATGPVLRPTDELRACGGLQVSGAASEIQAALHSAGVPLITTFGEADAFIATHGDKYAAVYTGDSDAIMTRANIITPFLLPAGLFVARTAREAEDAIPAEGQRFLVRADVEHFLAATVRPHFKYLEADADTTIRSRLVDIAALCGTDLTKDLLCCHDKYLGWRALFARREKLFGGSRPAAAACTLVLYKHKERPFDFWTSAQSSWNAISQNLKSKHPGWEQKYDGRTRKWLWVNMLEGRVSKDEPNEIRQDISVFDLQRVVFFSLRQLKGEVLPLEDREVALSVTAGEASLSTSHLAAAGAGAGAGSAAPTLLPNRRGLYQAVSQGILPVSILRDVHRAWLPGASTPSGQLHKTHATHEALPLHKQAPSQLLLLRPGQSLLWRLALPSQPKKADDAGILQTLTEGLSSVWQETEFGVIDAEGHVKTRRSHLLLVPGELSVPAEPPFLPQTPRDARAPLPWSAVPLVCLRFSPLHSRLRAFAGILDAAASHWHPSFGDGRGTTKLRAAYRLTPVPHSINPIAAALDTFMSERGPAAGASRHATGDAPPANPAVRLALIVGASAIRSLLVWKLIMGSAGLPRVRSRRVPGEFGLSAYLPSLAELAALCSVLAIRATSVLAPHAPAPAGSTRAAGAAQAGAGARLGKRAAVHGATVASAACCSAPDEEDDDDDRYQARHASVREATFAAWYTSLLSFAVEAGGCLRAFSGSRQAAIGGRLPVPERRGDLAAIDRAAAGAGSEASTASATAGAGAVAEPATDDPVATSASTGASGDHAGADEQPLPTPFISSMFDGPLFMRQMRTVAGRSAEGLHAECRYSECTARFPILPADRELLADKVGSTWQSILRGVGAELCDLVSPLSGEARDAFLDVWGLVVAGLGMEDATAGS